MSRSSFMGTAVARRKAEEQQRFEDELKASQMRDDPRSWQGDPTLPAIVGHHTGGPDYKFKVPRQVK